MGFSHERRQLTPVASNTRRSDPAESDGGALTLLSRPIELGGVCVGVAVAHELGVRFIAVDPRVTEMNDSIWPNFDYAKESARQMFRSNRSFASS